MARLSIRQKSVCFLIIFSFLAFVFSPLSAQESFSPAQVRDISDRAYEPAIIGLLDEAKESIVISMYNISLGVKDRSPITFLLQDLIEARQRGVVVTIYLNTNFREIDKEPHQLIRSPFFKKLVDAGCVFHLLPSRLRLHDKLITNQKISYRLKFLLMIKSLLESQGEDLYSISKQELARRFHIHPWTVGEAFKELKQYEKGG